MKNVRLADRFTTAFCKDPDCGLHIVASDEDGVPICEIVMSVKTTIGVIELCKNFLYEKAAARDS